VIVYHSYFFLDVDSFAMKIICIYRFTKSRENSRYTFTSFRVTNKKKIQIIIKLKHPDKALSFQLLLLLKHANKQLQSLGCFLWRNIICLEGKLRYTVSYFLLCGTKKQISLLLFLHYCTVLLGSIFFAK